MYDINPFLLCDGYKTGHMPMYPEGTTLVYDNLTPRSNKHAPKGCDKVVVIGMQKTMMQLKEMFDKNFFKRHELNDRLKHNEDILLDEMEVMDSVCQEIKKEYSMYLGADYDVSHIEKLWKLGYLPIKVKALPEGTAAPMGVPVMTLYNTHPDFFWLPNFLETVVSSMLWKTMTAATIALQYRKNLTKWALETDETNLGFVDFQGHNFSMRGMDGIESSVNASLGHAFVFLGDDSLPTIHAARKFYHAEGGVVYSVNATEHSVMCAGGKEDEVETFRRLLKLFPTGILSVVSDTWDLWKVCTEILPQLKDEILARDGKLVIRPDSGDPVDIVCGEAYVGNLKYDSTGRGFPENGNWNNLCLYKNKYYKLVGDQHHKEWSSAIPKPKDKGVVELLWDLFGGTINDQGYKVLDPHIGCIYGDSITLDRAEQICSRLAEKGFASTNVVLGIGLTQWPLYLEINR